MRTLLPVLAIAALTASAAEPPVPKFRAFTLDDKIQIGYGLAKAWPEMFAYQFVVQAEKAS